MRLTPTVDRLKAAGFAHVEGALEFAGLREAPRFSPALFVVPQIEQASRNTLSAGAIDQRVVAGHNVILVLSTAQRARDVVDEQLHLDCERIKAALNGWMHPEASAPAEYGGGQLLAADTLGLAWSLRFHFAYHLRSYPTNEPQS